MTLVEKEFLEKLETIFMNLGEYWNENENHQAMADARWHTIDVSEESLTLLEEYRNARQNS